MKAHVRVGTVASLLLALVLSIGGVVAVTAAPASAATEAQLKYARSAFRATNEVRDKRDLVKLKKSKCLQRFANKQAVKLADLGDLVHQALAPVLEDCHLELAGENLAIGYATGRKAVKAWMKSPSHKANIVKRGYRVMAIAARKTPLGIWVCVQLFGRKA